MTTTWISQNKNFFDVIPNPINAKSFHPGSGSGSGQKECLFVGRLERRKGISTLVENIASILQNCPEASFRFIGKDGKDESGLSWKHQILTQLSREMNDRVSFEVVQRSNLVQAYRRASLCVFPSVWENCPYVLLEAMACATPAVTTKVGGFPEIIDDRENGVLVPLENPIALQTAICELLDDPERLKIMGQNARKKIETVFDINQIGPKMLEVYQKVLYDN